MMLPTPRKTSARKGSSVVGSPIVSEQEVSLKLPSTHRSVLRERLAHLQKKQIWSAGEGKSTCQKPKRSQGKDHESFNGGFRAQQMGHSSGVTLLSALRRDSVVGQRKKEGPGLFLECCLPRESYAASCQHAVLCTQSGHSSIRSTTSHCTSTSCVGDRSICARPSTRCTAWTPTAKVEPCL